MLSILFNLFIGSITDNLLHSFRVYIFVALDLLCDDAILLYSLLKLISPLSGKWHVIILEFSIYRFISIAVPLCKLREFSELVVVYVVEDEADLLVGFEEASNHA